MFTSLRLFPVARHHIVEFLNLQRESSEFAKTIGTLDDWTYSAELVAEKLGCTPLLESVELKHDEVIYITMSYFENEEHHNFVTGELPLYPIHNERMAALSRVVDLNRVVGCEFADSANEDTSEERIAN